MAQTKRKQPASVNVLVRIPVDVKRWLEDQAAEAFTSQNAEVLRALRERMNRLERERA